jgi:cytochrome c oxidase cbb3-type subunit III
MQTSSLPNRWLGTALAAFLLAFAAACGQERAMSRQAPAGAVDPGMVRQIPLVPGVRTIELDIPNPFEGDRQAYQAGQRLYDWMNCSGCHFAGGGGIGPPLMDDDWIYGGKPAQIYDSIASGRANGMPAYGDKLPADQIWHIVTYVMTLGDAAGRRQHGSPQDPRQHER